MAERSQRSGTAGAATGASSATDRMAGQAEGTAQQAGAALRAGRDQALAEARTMVRDAVDQQRRSAADSLGGMAQALHRSARDLEKENTMMARYTDMAADRLDDAAQYLRQANWREILEGAEGFARRQPYWFIGGAVAAGFVLARFLKSSGAEGMAETTGATARGGSAYAPGGTAGAGYGAAPGAASPYASPASSVAPTGTGDLT